MNFGAFWENLSNKLDIIIKLLERIAVALEAQWR